MKPNKDQRDAEKYASERNPGPRLDLCRKGETEAFLAGLRKGRADERRRVLRMLRQMRAQWTPPEQFLPVDAAGCFEHVIAAVRGKK